MVESNTKTSRLWLAAALVSLCVGPVGLSGCDDDPPPAAPKKKNKPRKKAAPAKAAAAAAPVNGYAKIPEEHRRELGDKDFRVDRTGDENRDPFHSFVLFPSERLEGGEVVKVTDICEKAEWVASEVSVSSLQLIGIITHGTKGWAQFRDGAGLGHIVGRAQCLGKEKAMVEQIGDSFVRLRVVPEAAPGAAAPPAQVKDYSLSPEELQLSE